VKHRARKRCFKPVLPSIVTGNVRSLVNKMDESTAVTRHQSEPHGVHGHLNKGANSRHAALDGFRIIRRAVGGREEQVDDRLHINSSKTKELMGNALLRYQ